MEVEVTFVRVMDLQRTHYLNFAGYDHDFTSPVQPFVHVKKASQEGCGDHRGISLLLLRNRTALFLNEAASTLDRRVRNSPDPVWLQGPSMYPQVLHMFEV